MVHVDAVVSILWEKHSLSFLVLCLGVGPKDWTLRRYSSRRAVVNQALHTNASPGPVGLPSLTQQIDDRASSSSITPLRSLRRVQMVNQEVVGADWHI